MRFGLPRGSVWLEEYTDEWSRSFVEERDRMAAALGRIILAIEHVGSTAVPGLCAKPVVDIAIGVADLEIGRQCIPPLTQLGYEHRGDAGIAGRHFFAKGPPENRTHYVHVEPLNGELWRNHILFRDYLRVHSEAALSYGQLKRMLAAQNKNDRDAYAAGKNPFIENVIAQASTIYELDEKGRARLRQ
jgi:GrpB-like predicted nucleotidyltransferase (UPF0157 family)